MTTREINFIGRNLVHPGFELVPDNPGMYKIKEGYNLPVTAYKMVPASKSVISIGHTKYRLDCVLPETSTFSCKDKFCKEIFSDCTPVINKETFVGKCFGSGCMDNDWEHPPKNVKNSVRTYEFDFLH